MTKRGRGKSLSPFSWKTVLAAGLEFEALVPEKTCSLLLPGTVRKACLVAEIGQILIKIPALFYRHLGQKDAAAAHVLQDKAMPANLDCFRIGAGGKLVQNGDFHSCVRPFTGLKGTKAGIPEGRSLGHVPGAHNKGLRAHD